MPLLQTSGNVTADAFGGGVAAVPNYIEDVFSTYLYTGTGATQTITNGIDLSGKGGLVWQKNRTQSDQHILSDTANGVGKFLFGNLTNAQQTDATAITQFNPTGFTFGGFSRINFSGDNFASWTFRKQPKFFDVVTWTVSGNPAGNPTTQNHSLDSLPGMVIIKKTSGTSAWFTLCRTSVGTYYQGLSLNGTQAAAGTPSAPAALGLTTTTFFTGGFYDGTNFLDQTDGQTYVAYLFAHNAGGFGLTGADNVISCGSYTGNGAAVGPTVTLGYEPQWLLIKRTSTDGAEWVLYDNMRGLPVGSGDAALYPNASYAEYANGNDVAPTATGFYLTNGNGTSNLNGATYIYIAIRRGPMKVPTDGTKVFNAITAASDPSNVDVGFPTDLFLANNRGGASNRYALSRLTGGPQYLTVTTTQAELTYAGTLFDLQNKFTSAVLFGGTPTISYMFRRAPSFFDEVCYTGTGVARTVAHNLAAVPELMIVKSRSINYNWYVYVATLGAGKELVLNSANPEALDGLPLWNSTSPTSTVFTLGSDATVNQSGQTYVAYLFATCAGVSKVGSYTGNGTTQAIACGFAGGARFVLIKATSTAGNWLTFDTARGMTVLTDPYLNLNSAAAETATLGACTTTTGGFTVNEAILAGVNTSGVSYIFLSVA